MSTGDEDLDSTSFWKKFFHDANLNEKDILECSSIFTINGTDQTIISEITDQDLEKIGIKDLFLRKKIMKHANEINKKGKLKTIEVAGHSLVNDLDLTLLTTDSKNLRRDFYIRWANSRNVEAMFNQIINIMKGFFENHLIKIPGNDKSIEDILYLFVGKKNPKTDVEFEPLSITSQVMVHDYCLSKPVPISEDILVKYNRTAASSNMKEIGYQHIYMHKMKDSSASSASSSSEDCLEIGEFSEPLRKKLKTCQASVLVDCQELLAPHQKNSTRLFNTEIKLDILIHCPSESIEVCKKLASHLGIIFVEDVIDKIEENAKKRTELYVRTANKNAKLYRLFQSYVNKLLMLGCSNVALTCNSTIFMNIAADVKCMIYMDSSDMTCQVMSPYVQICVQVKNNEFLEYISAVTKIINEILACEASMPAIYYKCIDDVNTFYKVKFPIIGIIPMYIVNFIAKKQLLQPNVQKTLIC